MTSCIFSSVTSSQVGNKSGNKSEAMQHALAAMKVMHALTAIKVEQCSMLSRQ